MKTRSDNYFGATLLGGSILMLLVFSFFIFSPLMFGDYLIFTGTILAFFVGSFISIAINPIHALLIRKNEKKRQVQIMAHAIFSKSKIYETKKRTGLLIFVSLLEKQLIVKADKKLYEAIPQEEWDIMQKEMESSITFGNLQADFLDNLKKTGAIFSKYIPVEEPNINELPDYIELDF